MICWVCAALSVSQFGRKSRPDRRRSFHWLYPANAVSWVGEQRCNQYFFMMVCPRSNDVFFLQWVFCIYVTYRNVVINVMGICRRYMLMA